MKLVPLMTILTMMISSVGFASSQMGGNKDCAYQNDSHPLKNTAYKTVTVKRAGKIKIKKKVKVTNTDYTTC